MAQIFVSHSSQDRELVDMLARALAATKVRAIYEEFEAITQGPATAQRITQHIAQANVVFVVLGRSTRSFP
jgi:TIR domain